jgi:hypothetical protein
MRAAISVFITGLVLSSLAVNTQTSGLDVSNSGSQQLVLAKSNTKKPPRRPWRGSGREEEKLMQFVESTPPAV